MLARIASKTLTYHAFLWARRRWRRGLIRRPTTVLAGVALDIASCSAYMRNVILDGWYEEAERELCLRHLDAEDRVLEIGAAIGFLALFCRLRIGIATYAMVEANPGTLEMLRRNFSLNRLVPEVLWGAVCDHSGEVDLDIGGEFWANSIATGSGKRVRVPAFTLADVLGRIGFAPTALIVDIEGAEIAIDPAMVPDSVSTIVMELHPAVTGLGAMHHLLSRYDRAGFSVIDQVQGTYLLRRTGAEAAR